jgi:hypothetical protein
MAAPAAPTACETEGRSEATEEREGRQVWKSWMRTGNGAVEIVKTGETRPERRGTLLTGQLV